MYTFTYVQYKQKYTNIRPHTLLEEFQMLNLLFYLINSCLKQ